MGFTEALSAYDYQSISSQYFPSKAVWSLGTDTDADIHNYFLVLYSGFDHKLNTSHYRRSHF